VVTSSELLNTKQLQNANAHLIENGVDFQLFNQAWISVKNNEIKRIGYIGSIDHRLDYPLLRAVITAMKDKTFVFVGRVTSHQEAKSLSRLPNVEFVPAQAPQALPGLLKTIDIGMIPFLKNNFTKNIYPLKINEYLAAGLPVVATSFTDFSLFGSLVSIANTSEGFCNEIYQLLHADNMDVQKDRMNFAIKNDWSERAFRMETLLKNSINKS
jgi:glycosyltransferase involved in cell wall biosynthesis